MTRQEEEVFTQALQLSDKRRAQLANALLQSLDGEPEDPETVDEAWRKEIARRVEDLEAGRAKTTPWAEVREELRAMVSKRRDR